VEAAKKEDRSATRNNVNPNGPNGDAIKGVRPLTSVELLDAAVWQEIGTEDPQPASAFIEALASLVARWLLVRSETPGDGCCYVNMQDAGLHRERRRRTKKNKVRRSRMAQ
jgi:hypothetical protein